MGARLWWRRSLCKALVIKGGVDDDRLLATTISPVARLFAGGMIVHLAVEDSFRQRLFQIVE